MACAALADLGSEDAFDAFKSSNDSKFVYQNLLFTVKNETTLDELQYFATIWNHARTIFLLACGILFIFQFSINVHIMRLKRKKQQGSRRRRSYNAGANAIQKIQAKLNKVNVTERISILSLCSTFSSFWFWYSGGSFCQNQKYASIVAYAILVALNFHIAAYWLGLMQELVAQQKQFQKVFKQSMTKHLMVIAPGYINIVLCIFALLSRKLWEETFLKTFVEYFRVTYLLLLLATIAVGWNTGTFGFQAVKALRSMVSQNSSDSIRSLCFRIQVLTLFFVGASLTVICLELVIIITDMMYNPVFHAVIINYFCGLFYAFSVIGLYSDKSRVSSLKSTLTKVSTYQTSTMKTTAVSNASAMTEMSQG